MTSGVPRPTSADLTDSSLSTYFILFVMVLSLAQDVKLVVSRALPVQDILNFQAVRELLNHFGTLLAYNKPSDVQGTLQSIGIA